MELPAVVTDAAHAAFQHLAALRAPIAEARVALWQIFCALCAPEENDESVELPVASFAALAFLRGAEVVREVAR